MPKSVVTQLMFEGKAEEAMALYVSLFSGSVVVVEKYKAGEHGPEGTIKRAEFTIAGHRLACIDSPIKHAFTFTPSASLFVECADEAELDRAFAALSEGGAVLMPPGNYGFSTKFAWVSDRFGVSWQLNLVAQERAMSTERVMTAGPQQVYAAFERPELLARWWGPKGFTNTFEQFEFKPGGRWVFTMHGPNGTDYANENAFRELRPDRIVIEHVSQPHFVLTVTLTTQGDRTHLSWVQEFDSPEVAAKLRPLITDANEQNLDRLEAVLADER